MELPPRLWDTGQYKGLPIYEETLCNLSVGRRTTLRAEMLLWNPEGHKMTTNIFRQKFVLQADIPESASRIALINVRITRDHRGTIATPDELSQCLILEGMKVDDLYRLKETCTGIGALGKGAQYAGWQTTVANEKQQKIASLLEKVTEAQVVVGDIAFGSTIGDIHRADPRPSAWAFGFNCQSFSRGGDMRGGEDERAMTLPRSLHAAYLLNLPIIVIECVAEAPTFAFVKQALSQFCEITGFVKSEIILELQKVWVANRQRWWCVLAHGEIGKIPLSPLPKVDNAPTISDFMDEFQPPKEEVQQQLQLTDHELSQLTAIGANLPECEVNQHAPMPTALHSWGNQFQACRCECRSTGLSTSRMMSRGFYGVLIKKHDVEGKVTYRHPSAQETALLCGLPIVAPEDDARLALCAVGQLASPIQSAWIFAEIRQHLKHQKIGNFEHANPSTIVGNVCQSLFDLRRELWPEMKETLAMKFFEKGIKGKLLPSTDPAFVEPAKTEIMIVEENEGDSINRIGIEVGNITEGCMNRDPKRRKTQIDSFAEKLTAKCREQQNKARVCERIPGAVAGFSNSPEKVEPTIEESVVDETKESTGIDSQNFFVEEGMGVSPKDLLEKRLVIFDRIQSSVFAVQVSDGAKVRDLMHAEGHNSAQVRVVTTLGKTLHQEAMLGMHQCVVIEAIGKNDSKTLVELQLESCHTPRYQTILCQQGWVAYDEMQLYLSALATKNNVCKVDPLIIQDLEDVPLLVEAWLHGIGQAVLGGTVITAILWCGHWIPFVFQHGIEKILGITTEEGSNVWHLTNNNDCEVVVEGNIHQIFPKDCGFQAFAWLSARIGTGNGMGKMDSDSAEGWRFLFWQQVMMNPEVANQKKYVTFGGHGDELQLAVAAILKDHGVFGERVVNRAKEVVDKLGKTEVQQAIKSIRPWVALKQLANQLTPKLNLVWEDEFNLVVKSRSKQSKAVGWKRNDGEKVSLAKVTVLPEDIQVPAGVFIQDDGSAVQQIAIQQVGSIGKGLVVCTEEEAHQFLHESCLSNQGLAFAVVNPSNEFVAANSEPERFPASCVSTQEPMLVSAVIVQKGKQGIKRASPSTKPRIDEVPVKTAKVLVYKDQVEVPWDNFQEGPMKYIVNQLRVLAVCRKPGCKCESWHVGESQNEPLLDVWNRDFLTTGFKKARPSESELFACAIRVRSEVFPDIMKQSGQGGIYIEPRSDDGKMHCNQHHTVWLNKMAHNEAVAACAKAKTPAFLIRVNRRYGLKTPLEHANELHKQFRADVPMMQGNANATFTLGPLPWGTTRKSLQELFNHWGWQARALQPAGRSADGKGLLWNALASSPPGSSVVQMEHGDIIIVRKEVQPISTPDIPAVEASSHTRKSLQHLPIKPKPEDPWAEAAARLPSVRSELTVSNHQILQIEKSLEEKLTKKMGSEDVQMDPALEPRVKDLEEKLARIADVQQQQHAQTSSIATQVQSIQSQVEKQSKDFQAHLDSKLETQMNKIEALLTKRARQE